MTGQNIQTIIEYRTLVRHFLWERGIIIMSQNEIELFNILYEHNAEQAMLTAIKVFAAFLEQLEEAPTPPLVCPLEFA